MNERERREAIYRRHAEMQVIQLAIKDHRGCAPEWCGGSDLDPCSLFNAIEDLERRYQRTGSPLAEAFEREAEALVHQLDAPQHDPISGDLIPAGQDAELEQMGREPTEIEHDLAELVLNVAQEWLRYASLGERDEQVRCTWHNDAEGETLHVESETGHGGRFKIHVRAQQLPDLPPIAPENDLGIYGIGETHGSEPDWIERTMADVRRGDRIRMPGRAGSETSVLDRYLPPQPPGAGGGLPSDRGIWHVVPGDRGHWDDHVVQPSDCWLLLTGQDEPLNFPPTMPVEILLAPSEINAIDTLGWENRA